ncbi:hypothetical protein, partial [Klebsiella pneumoniae]|uniref:hypothetical protein n=1 Tax=Klebsiella pneumoniae TaxID=573 RepID=UPI00283D3025
AHFLLVRRKYYSIVFDALAASKNCKLKLCGDQTNSSKILEQENSPQILPNAFLLLMKSLLHTPLRISVPKSHT